MKKILIPTDFSINAQKAADYGMFLAQKFGAQVHLIHAYRFYYDEDGYFINVQDKLDDVAESKLKIEQDRLLTAFPSMKDNVTTEAIHGFLIDVLVERSKTKEDDLIIMGTKGASGFEEVLIGTLTVSAINRVDTPLLVVPLDNDSHQINRIAFAADYHDMNANDILFIKSFGEKFDATIDLVKVLAKKDEVDAITDFDKMGLKYDQLLTGVKHEFHYQSHEDIEEGIMKYLDNHPADLLCVYARKHGFVSGLFHRSIAKKLAYHTHMPLLVIKER